MSTVSDFPLANRREARKLGLLRSKSSEAERERMEPQERNERVCGEESDTVLILCGNLILSLPTESSHGEAGEQAGEGKDKAHPKGARCLF